MDPAATEKINQLKTQLDDPNPSKRQIAIKKLLSINSPDVLDLILGKADDVDADVRMYIATGLGQFIEFKEKIFPAIQKFFKDTDRHVKLSAIKSAMELKDPKIIPNLLQLVKHTNKEIRIASLEGLIEFKAKEMFPLVDVFLLDTDVKVRATTIKAYAISPEKITLDKFIPLIEDDNGEVRANAAAILGTTHTTAADQPIYAQFLREEEDFVKMAQIEALGKMKFGKAINELKKYVSNENETELRMAACFALGELADKSVLEELMSCANDEETDLRINAIEALGKIADPGAIPVLEQLKEDEDEEVQEAATCAIEKIQEKIEASKKVVITIPAPQITPQIPNTVTILPNISLNSSTESKITTSKSLSPVSSQDALEKLIQNLSAADNVTRVKASRLLAAWQPIPFELFLKILDSEDPMQRAYMAETLGLIGDKRAIMPLRNLLKDFDTSVQAFVQWALMRCGDPEFREQREEHGHPKTKPYSGTHGGYQDRGRGQEYSHDHAHPQSRGPTQGYSREQHTSSSRDNREYRPRRNDSPRSNPHSKPYHRRNNPEH
jgi:HEAT repeat protein